MSCGGEPAHESVAYLKVERTSQGQKAKVWRRGLTFVEEFLLHTRFQRASEGMLADKFKVLGHIVHFLPFQVGDYDEDVVASMIVHSPQEHQFRKLWPTAA